MVNLFSITYSKPVRLKNPPCRRKWAAAGGVALHLCHEQGRGWLIYSQTMNFWIILL